jgi:hypothetical protein
MGMGGNGMAAQRAALLDEMTRWIVPVTPAEEALAAIIAALPVQRIRRMAQPMLDRLGMHGRDCHGNVRAFTARHGGRPCAGWWRLGSEAYVLHSVAATAQGLVCVSPYNGETELDFAPDPLLTAVPGGFVRNGRPAPLHVRTDPARVIAECSLIRDRLLAGWDPAEAVIVPKAPVRAASAADRAGTPQRA